MSTKTMELVVNSRPDANGNYWLMLQDTRYSDASEWAGRIARYFTANHTFGDGSTVRVDAGVYVAITAAGEHIVTCIVRRVSEFFTGHPLQARFLRADDAHLNAGPSDEATVGPVLRFMITAEERAV